jgi:hypothetical protein
MRCRACMVDMGGGLDRIVGLMGEGEEGSGLVVRSTLEKGKGEGMVGEVVRCGGDGWEVGGFFLDRHDGC